MTHHIENERAPPTRLARKLTTFDAVVIGLGSMIGAGVFAVVGPAAQAAGSGLLLALLIAALVAYCNALSSAQLAALIENAVRLTPTTSDSGCGPWRSPRCW